ncbi:MAG TPA: arsenite methyltransferase [Dehalococcoidia bacterium]|nr:arsenite methyltransferase [Dehalococcoidia bacterium]
MTQQGTSDREIKQAVTEQYGARARAALADAGTEVGATASCCGPSGSQQASDDGCGCGQPGELASTLYSGGELSDVPKAAQLAAAGCGNPVAIAELQAGESVLDLGSGGGIDCFLAGKQVGQSGEVWGVDMTPDMVQLARTNAEKVEATNVHFRLGEIEDLPFEAAQFDTVISNCVINLSVDKPQVFRETFRVLKPGGRLRVSDIVVTGEPAEQQDGDTEQWAACVTGALPIEEYVAAVRDAGFVDVNAEYKGGADGGTVSAYVTAFRPE